MQGIRRFALVLLVLSAMSAAAYGQQNQLEAPRNAEPGATAPQQVLPASPVPPSSQIDEIPQVYLGCWRARIEQPDSWQHISGPRLGP